MDRNQLMYAAGIVGVAVLGMWLASRRRAQKGKAEDDVAADLIAMYRPAIERALEVAS